MSFRRNLMLFTAFTTVVALQPAYHGQAAAQTATPDATGTPNPTSTEVGDSGGAPLDIEVKRQQLLLKQKDVTSAITEVGAREIEAQGVQGSIATLLQQSAPNVFVYQQGPGANYPVIAVRGIRGDELSTTLDGIPTQDLLYGGVGGFETNNIGGFFNLDQIDGVTVYPGVTSPGTQGYGAAGGTLAYSSKKPTDESYVDVFGSIGSFSTSDWGFEANSGKVHDLADSKFLLRYSSEGTGGYVDNTQAKYRDMLAAFETPYGDGLSKVSGFVIYNNDFGYIQSQPTPSALLDTYGPYYNFPKSQSFLRQQNDFLTVAVKDETYINDDLFFSLNAFYLRSNSVDTSYENPSVFQNPQGQLYSPSAALPSYYYFTQVPFNFYPQIGIGTPYTNKTFFNYNPAIYGNPALGYGENAQVTEDSTELFGFQPKLNIFLPFNNITIGGLFAREKEAITNLEGGTVNVAEEPGINVGPGLSTATRAIYQGYFQDKIDLLDNTLHFEPGFTYQGQFGQNNVLEQNFQTGPGYTYQLKAFFRDFLPYVGASYDLPYNVSIYGSWGESALFAPISDYALGSNGSTTTAPGEAILRAYEAGIRYNTDQLYMNLDGYYQKTDRAFGFYSNPLANINQYSNIGNEEFKGVEAAFKYKITDEISTFGNAGYVKATYLAAYPAFVTLAEDQFGYVFKGQPVAGVPDWTASLGIDYNKKSQFLENDEVFLRFFGNYAGRRINSIDIDPNAIFTAYPNGFKYGTTTISPGSLAAATTPGKNIPAGLPIPSSVVTSLKPFLIFNAVADYTLPINYAYVKQVKFELNLQNIFNTHYFGYYYSQFSPLNGSYAITGKGFNDGLVAPPFAATFTATVRF
jgi:iron complex outermembrane receptor protein